MYLNGFYFQTFFFFLSSIRKFRSIHLKGFKGNELIGNTLFRKCALT